MQMLRKAGCEEFVFYTSEGTLLQNVDGMVSVVHARTRGSLQHRGPGRCVLLLFPSSGFTVGSVSGTEQSGFWSEQVS